MELIRPDTQIDFIGKRKYALVISTIVILISFGSIFLHGGLKYGVDFAGGILLQIRFSKSVDISEVRNALEAIGIEGCHGPEIWGRKRVFDPNRKEF